MSDEILALETRRDLHTLIMEYPGLHMREIHRKLDMPIALAEYHLNYLEKAEIITSNMEGGYKRYYVHHEYVGESGVEIGHQERKVLGVLRQKIPLHIILFLLKNKKATHTEISNSLNISPSKASFHLNKLLKAGIVRKSDRAEGKGYIVENETQIQRQLIMYRPLQDMLDEFIELWESLELW